MKKVMVFIIIGLLISCEKETPPDCIITSPIEGENIVQGKGLKIYVDGYCDYEFRLYVDEVGIDTLHSSNKYFGISTNDISLGPHNIKVVAVNESGNSASDEVLVMFIPTIPYPHFSFGKTMVEVNEIVNFIDETKNSPSSWHWDFGDGKSSNLQNPNHAYELAGKYEVTLTATNVSGSNSETEKIVVVNPVSFNPNLTYGSITDIDGNNYRTIQIGYQTWMAENLKVTQYNDGTDIELVDWYFSWHGIELNDKEAYAWSNFTEENESSYGAYYSQGVVMNSSHNVCPKGWVIPTDEDWMKLEEYLGMSSDDINTNYRYRGTKEGAKLKEVGTKNWVSPNSEATNETGFTATPGGYISTTNYPTVIGDYVNSGNSAIFWSAGTTQGIRGLKFDESTILRWINSDLNGGYSVRCVKW